MLFLEIVERLQSMCSVKKCKYYGLSGPFLDDVRLLTSRFQHLKAVSIERDEQTHLRQKFHKPSRLTRFENTTIDDYLTHKFIAGSQCIFWLDYIDFRLKRTNEFESLLNLVGNNSIIKVTVNVSGGRNEIEIAADKMPEQSESLKEGFADNFYQRFYRHLNKPVSYNELSRSHAPNTVQNIFRVIATKALFPTNKTFQLLHSCEYQDGVHQMLSLTGIVTSEPQLSQGKFSEWKFANLDWQKPEKLNVPELSVKERLVLERHLPGTSRCVENMQKSLGYAIGADPSDLLKQYHDYHSLLPMFAKFGV